MCTRSSVRGGSRGLLGLSFFALLGEFVATLLLHALEHFRHVLDRAEHLGRNIDGALLLDRQRDAVTWAGIDLQDFLAKLVFCAQHEPRVVRTVLEVVNNDALYFYPQSSENVT